MDDNISRQFASSALPRTTHEELLRVFGEYSDFKAIQTLIGSDRVLRMMWWAEMASATAAIAALGLPTPWDLIAVLSALLLMVLLARRLRWGSRISTAVHRRYPSCVIKDHSSPLQAWYDMQKREAFVKADEKGLFDRPDYNREKIVKRAFRTTGGGFLQRYKVDVLAGSILLSLLNASLMKETNWWYWRATGIFAVTWLIIIGIRRSLDISREGERVFFRNWLQRCEQERTERPAIIRS